MNINLLSLLFKNFSSSIQNMKLFRIIIYNYCPYRYTQAKTETPKRLAIATWILRLEQQAQNERTHPTKKKVL